MTDVSTFRLYLMRALYLLMGVGIGFDQLPGMLHHANQWTLMHGVGSSMLIAIGACALLGVRYPLQMLPVLLYELLWKTIWLAGFALPLWLAHQMDAVTMESVNACLMGIVLCPLVIPWPYVLANYVKKRGDRWAPVAPAMGRDMTEPDTWGRTS